MDLEDEYLVIVVNKEEQDNDENTYDIKIKQDNDENTYDIKIKQDEDDHTPSNQMTNLLEEISSGNLNEEQSNMEDDLLVPKIEEKIEIVKAEFLTCTPFLTKLLEDNPHIKGDKQAQISALVAHMGTVEPPVVHESHYYLDTDGCHVCKICDLKIRHKLAFNRHYLEKHGPRYLSCYTCSRAFRSTYSLYRHEKRCTEKGAPIVLQARSIFLQTKKKMDSIKSTGRYHCSYCSASFKTKSSVVSHERVHKAERPFRCDQCPVAYTTKSALVLHKKSYHGEASFICDHCGAAFKSKNSVSSHLSSHYEPRFPCEECSRRFTYKAALRLHVHRKHRNLPLPCACQICPRRFGRMSGLKEHMMNAHGVLLMTRTMFFRQLPKLTDSDIMQAKEGFKSEVPTIKPSDLEVLNDKIIQQIAIGEELLKKQEQEEDSGSLLNYETGEIVY